jgi:hypothetical protein
VKAIAIGALLKDQQVAMLVAAGAGRAMAPGAGPGGGCPVVDGVQLAMQIVEPRTGLTAGGSGVSAGGGTNASADVV